MKRAAVLLAAVGAASASASFRRHRGMQIGPMDESDSRPPAEVGQFNGWGTFDQLLDHADASKGTFRQRYWYGTEFWAGPGSPVILNTPGEQAATGFNRTYTTQQRLPGLMAKAMGGAVVILEHRYWGGSSPFEQLTVANLQHLSLANAIQDLTYFAKTWKAPFDDTGGSSPQNAPWVFSGGSYGGALAGWVAAKDPGTFWAYHATSGVVQTIGDFWQYFAPVIEAAPTNCSTDLNLVIEFIDHTLLAGTPDEKQALKAEFMLEDLQDKDFAAALENGPSTWQSTQFFDVKESGHNLFYQFCDYIEGVWPEDDPTKHAGPAFVPGAKGVGLAKALQGYAKWFTEVFLPSYCETSSGGYSDWRGTNNTGCFANLNASNPLYQDLSVSNNNGFRQWEWMLCNEPLACPCPLAPLPLCSLTPFQPRPEPTDGSPSFEYWQGGPPAGQPAIVSRLVDVDYYVAQCDLFFPRSQGGSAVARGKTADDVDAYTGGWDVANTTRLMYANGQLDPWRETTVSARQRPGGPLQSTAELPVRVIPGGVHCSDYYGQNWPLNADLRKLVDDEVANMVAWVNEFYVERNKTRPVPGSRR